MPHKSKTSMPYKSKTLKRKASIPCKKKTLKRKASMPYKKKTKRGGSNVINNNNEFLSELKKYTFVKNGELDVRVEGDILTLTHNYCKMKIVGKRKYVSITTRNDSYKIHAMLLISLLIKHKVLGIESDSNIGIQNSDNTRQVDQYKIENNNENQKQNAEAFLNHTNSEGIGEIHTKNETANDDLKPNDILNAKFGLIKYFQSNEWMLNENRNGQ